MPSAYSLAVLAFEEEAGRAGMCSIAIASRTMPGVSGRYSELITRHAGTLMAVLTQRLYAEVAGNAVQSLGAHSPGTLWSIKIGS